MDKYITAWRKIKRGIWKIPPTSHKYIVHNLSSDCKKLLEKRIIKCIHNALNNNNMCAQILKVKLRTAPLLTTIDTCHTNITLPIQTG